MTMTIERDGTHVWDTEAEAEAVAVAADLESRWLESDGTDGYRAYAEYAVSRGGWIVRPRAWMPGTCT
jgi:hypothetical protein